MDFVLFSLTVQEVLTMLEEMSNDEEFMNAAIIMSPTTNENLTDEDNGSDDAFRQFISYAITRFSHSRK